MKFERVERQTPSLCFVPKAKEIKNFRKISEFQKISAFPTLGGAIAPPAPPATTLLATIDFSNSQLNSKRFDFFRKFNSSAPALLHHGRQRTGHTSLYFLSVLPSQSLCFVPKAKEIKNFRKISEFQKISAFPTLGGAIAPPAPPSHDASGYHRLQQFATELKTLRFLQEI